ncbi:nucleolar protein 16-like [Physella acuta]|uniref:nucleolar protein 16-like n=1 Tax=Physella acuta TaxID=109671 RepID=UPI0027DE7D39|nr:nucleolar protein 16-like [Physella acuta]
MGKVKKQKRHLKFRYDKDRKKNWKKAKGMPTIKCEEIKKAWDETKTLDRNLEEMGISVDPNKTFPVPKSKVTKMGMLDVEMEVDLQKTPVKNFVIQDLEEKSKISGPKKMSMSEEDAGFCIYLMDKYGDNYKGMSRDERNFYQETPKQLQRKINRFKSIPEMYKVYAEARQATPEKCRTPLVTLSPTRYLTRRTEACRRNGHFVTPTSLETDAVFVRDAPLCRVRRKLQFGRKPPKERVVKDT